MVGFYNLNKTTTTLTEKFTQRGTLTKSKVVRFLDEELENIKNFENEDFLIKIHREDDFDNDNKSIADQSNSFQNRDSFKSSHHTGQSVDESKRFYFSLEMTFQVKKLLSFVNFY
jgi:hypothetical protein